MEDLKREISQVTTSTASVRSAVAAFWNTVALSVCSPTQGSSSASSLGEAQLSANAAMRAICVSIAQILEEQQQQTSTSPTSIPSAEACERCTALLLVISAIVHLLQEATNSSPDVASASTSTGGGIPSPLPAEVLARIGATAPSSSQNSAEKDEEAASKKAKVEAFQSAMIEAARREIERWVPPAVRPLLALAKRIQKEVKVNPSAAPSGVQVHMKTVTQVIKKWKTADLLSKEIFAEIESHQSSTATTKATETAPETGVVQEDASINEAIAITSGALAQRKALIESMLDLLAQLKEADAVPHWKALQPLVMMSQATGSSGSGGAKAAIPSLVAASNDEIMSQLAALKEAIASDVRRVQIQRQERSLATAASVAAALKRGAATGRGHMKGDVLLDGSSTVGDKSADSAVIPFHSRTLVTSLRFDTRKPEVSRSKALATAKELSGSSSGSAASHHRNPFSMPKVLSSVKGHGAVRSPFLTAEQWMEVKDFGDRKQFVAAKVRDEPPIVGRIVSEVLF